MTKLQKKTRKGVKKKFPKNIHIQDIPLRYFPKTKGNKSREYRHELTRMMISLRKTNQYVQYSAQVSIFNIKSITQKSGFVPSPPEVFRAIEDFVYHYENYCYRAFSFREKLFQFINAILPVGYPEKQRGLIKHLVINPVIKQAKLISIIKKFDNDKTLKSVIDDRHSLTHRLYYGGSFDHFLRPTDAALLKSKEESKQKKWFDDWKEEIERRAKMTNDFTRAVSKINHNVAPKIIAYKDSLKNK